MTRRSTAITTPRSSLLVSAILSPPMTAYKRYNTSGTQSKQHIPYGHELNQHEKELVQEVQEKRANRQQVFQEIRRRRAASYKRLREQSR